MATTIWTDEALSLAVIWHGGATFNVHEISEEGGFGRVFIGAEVDVFTRYGTDQSTDLRPTLVEAAQAAREYFARQAEGDDMSWLSTAPADDEAAL